MYKNYKLSNFFLLVILLVVAVSSFIAYAWRTNAPANIFEHDGETYSSWFKEKGVDVSAPFYDNAASAPLGGDRMEKEHASPADKDGVDFPSKGEIDSVGSPKTPAHSGMEMENKVDSTTQKK